MHEWGDGWPYWDMLHKAHDQIERTFRRLTGCTLISKEKYGTLRYEYILGPGHSLCYYDWNVSKVKRAALAVSGWWAVRCWRILWWVIKYYAKKYPNVKHELYEDIASRADIVGKKIHDKYWRSL